LVDLGRVQISSLEHLLHERIVRMTCAIVNPSSCIFISQGMATEESNTNIGIILEVDTIVI